MKKAIMNKSIVAGLVLCLGFVGNSNALAAITTAPTCTQDGNMFAGEMINSFLNAYPNLPGGFTSWKSVSAQPGLTVRTDSNTFLAVSSQITVQLCDMTVIANALNSQINALKSNCKNAPPPAPPPSPPAGWPSSGGSVQPPNNWLL